MLVDIHNSAENTHCRFNGEIIPQNLIRSWELKAINMKELLKYGYHSSLFVTLNRLALKKGILLAACIAYNKMFKLVFYSIIGIPVTTMKLYTTFQIPIIVKCTVLKTSILSEGKGVTIQNLF